MDALITYYSWTGATETVARRIAENFAGHNVRLQRIEAVSDRSYFVWLLRSLIPSSKVRIKPILLDLSGYDLLIVGGPKWSLGCPPYNEFVKRMENVNGVRAAFFMTYGGFDQERYESRAIEKLRGRGLDVVGKLSIKRRKVRTGDYEPEVDFFCRRLLGNL